MLCRGRVETLSRRQQNPKLDRDDLCEGAVYHVGTQRKRVLMLAPRTENGQV
jgi:hypothetical protein